MHWQTMKVQYTLLIYSWHFKMDVVQRASVWLFKVMTSAHKDDIVSTQTAMPIAVSRKQRLERFKHCMRYPSPYKAELTQLLQTISPDPKMVKDAGYCLVDLLDLQLGWHELSTIGFTKSDLCTMGMTHEMAHPLSVYAPLLAIDNSCINEEPREIEDSYYL